MVHDLDSTPLIGRAEELAFMRSAAANHGPGIVVQGPAGIGKTAFAQAAATSLQMDVEWVQATHAASAIMLGAFAQLLDPKRRETTVAMLVASIVADLRSRAKSEPFTLVIDDAHLLDGASATALTQIVGVSGIFVILTTRSGENAPDAVESLVLPKLALQSLSLEEVGQLVGLLLDGVATPATTKDLYRVTNGNPLFLRELVRGEHESRRIVEGDMGWQWQAGPASVRSLAEVIDRRIGSLTEDEERALVLLAYAGAAELALLDHLVAPTTLASLEDRELVVSERDHRRLAVRVAHPLYEEHLRARTGPLRVRQMCGELIDALGRIPGRRRSDRLRNAIWRLERGDLVDPETLIADTLHVQRSFHVSMINALAPDNVAGPSPDDQRVDELVQRYEREGPREAEQAHKLGLAAWTRSPSFETGIAVVLMQTSGVVPDGELMGLLDQLDRLAVTTAERRSVALEHASFAFWHRRRPEDAFRVLETAADANDNVDDRALLLAVRAGYALHAGDSSRAVQIGSTVYGDVGLEPYPRIVASVPLAGGLCLAGRLDEGLRVIDEVLPDALEHSLEDPRVIGDLMYAKVAGLVGSGRYEDAEETAASVYRLALEHGNLVGVGQFGAWLGTVALYRGHADEAIRHLSQADRLLAMGAGVHSRSHILGNLAAAHALAGHRAAARETLSMARAEHPMPRFFDTDIELAESWILAAEGRIHEGAARAVVAARRAIERGCLVYATTAADVAARLGSPAAEELLVDLLPRVDGPVCALALERAVASRTTEPERLETVSKRFMELGLDLTAAESAFEAGTIWRSRGHSQQATNAVKMMSAALTRCVGTCSPTIDGAPHVLDGLTKREREVVELARSGLSSPAIADQLFLSVRTVETHLYRAFAKLGISRRSDLLGR